MNLLLIKVAPGRHRRAHDLCRSVYSGSTVLGPSTLSEATRLLAAGRTVHMALALIDESEPCQMSALARFRQRYFELPLASMHVGPRQVSRPVEPAAPSELTEREREVLDSIQRGVSNKGIARELGVAEGTVKVHCVSIYRKLGVNNRTQAAMAVPIAARASLRPTT